MIIDRMENSSLYFGLHQEFERTFRWLRSMDPGSLVQPRYVLEEGRIWATVQRYQSKPRRECSVEGHRNYIDIQYVLSGCELVGYETRAGQIPCSEYDEEHDIQFFQDHCDLLTVPAGFFYIAGPEDLHMTKCMNGSPCDIVKLVAKVRTCIHNR